MRWGIFSDIHSNLEALEAVVKAYKSEGIDKYLCLGDIVGYGANPVECIRIIKEIAYTTIAGNHDWAVANLFPVKNLNDWAKKAVLWTQKQLDSANLNFLASLNLTHESIDFILVHGSLDAPSEFKYLFDISQAEQTFKLMRPHVCFLGHTHSPEVFIQNSEGRLDYQKPPILKIEEGYRYIINVGSVGQSRDRNNKASFCIYDTDTKEFTFKRVKYNIKLAQEKIILAGLPSFLAVRLAQGR